MRLVSALAKVNLAVMVISLVLSASACERTPYKVVAAGMIRGDNGDGRPRYNNLRVSNIAAGQITFTFDGYRQPDASLQYVVKAHGVSRTAVRVPTVRFLDFRPGGFVLQVTRGDALLTISEIYQTEFVIEVSSYQKGNP